LSFTLEKSISYFKEISLQFAPSVKVVKALSISQEPLISDLFFASTAIYLGGNYKTPKNRNLDWMYGNLEVITFLDPDFRSAYFYGGMIIPLGKEQVKRGIKFLEEGMQRSPRDWHLPFWIGCNYYYELKDYPAAAEYFARAAKLPSSPEFLDSVRAVILYKAKQPKTALNILEVLRSSVESKEAKVLLERKINWLKNVVELEEVVARFKDRFLRLPDSLEELVSRGLLKSIPDDPFGQGYFLDSNTGNVKSFFGPNKQAEQKDAASQRPVDRLKPAETNHK
jgi:tetratricopeptide (TPR) repeat protein